MNPFHVKKITYIATVLEIIFPIAIAVDTKHSIWYLAMMLLILAGIIIALLKYWKCPHCKNYFPISMSLSAKHCPTCGEKLQ
jgi:rubrerythrin